MRAVIFDLDGTLLDSLADIADAMNTVLRRMDLPAHGLAAYREMLGHGLESLVRRSVPADHAISDVIAAMREEYGQHAHATSCPTRASSRCLRR